MTRLVVGPFNRVEGDLEVRLDHDGRSVRSAEVVSPLFRGFERILAGKPPSDALVYAPRICGICSVSQSVAAARALAATLGVAPPADGQMAINLIHAAENVADHLTHFYLFFMPDFARQAYAAETWHADAVARFAAGSGTATADMLPARAAFLHVMGLLAGKWPHTLAIRPGGVTRAVTGAMKARLAGVLQAFRRFLETRLFGDRLEAFVSLSSQSELSAWRRKHTGSDAARFLDYSERLGLAGMGASGAALMSYGAYPDGDGHLFRRGVFAAEDRVLDLDAIAEDAASTWTAGDRSPRGPYDGITEPGDGEGPGYTWCKAPRLAGAPAEVGALARQAVAGHPLIRDLLARNGGGVEARIVARLLEIAAVTLAMQGWISRLDEAGSFNRPVRDPVSGRGRGLTEAARGALGHWLVVENGRIANYQIIAPTTWNFSPRDGAGQPGPLERALEGAPIRPDETTPVSVQHIVRSFDPCMVCTVH